MNYFINMESSDFTYDIFNNLPRLSPIWHDIDYQQVIRKKEYAFRKKEKLIDVCGTGIDVSIHDGEPITSETKSATDKWNFAAASCALPFLPENKVKDLVDPCLTPLNEAKEKFQHFCLKLHGLRRGKTKDKFSQRVIFAYNKLKKMAHKEKYKKIAIPDSVMGLAIDYPEKTIFPPVNLLYSGGCLATSKSNNEHLILLHPIGEKLNKLGITSLEEADVLNKYFKAVLLEENCPTLKSGLILQVSSSINDYCYVRQKKSCHFIDYSDLHDVKHSRIIERQELVSISSSPYCPSDYLIIYDKGNLEFRNLEESEPLWTLFKYDYQCSYNEFDFGMCSFGSHPQSVLSLIENYLYSFDMRLKGNQSSILFSTDYSSCYLDEKLISCKSCAVSPFQHVVSSNYHLFVCDDRYPKRPVLIYNHLLNSFPLYCNSTIVSNTQNSSDVMVVLGTQDTCELSAFAIRAQHSTIQPVSLSPPLHLSTPTDCVESLKLHCIPVADSLEQRLSYPLVGIGVVPHSDSGYTVFQLNSLGDLLYQDFTKTTAPVEKSRQVSMGCVLTPPDRILPHLSQFMPNADEEKDVLEYSNHLSEKLNVDLTNVFSAMNDTPPFCKICNPEKASAITNEADNANKCNSCGYNAVEGGHMCDLINNFSLLIGPIDEPSLSEFFDVAQLREFNDQYSRKVLDVWDFEENEFNCDTPTYKYESDSSFTLTTPSSCMSPASSTSTLSANQSQNTPVQSTSQDDVMSQLLENISSLNSSLHDYSIQESYEDLVPPSQDIRPVVGETLRKPKKPRSINTSFSLKAGF